MSDTKTTAMSDFKFLYWDDPGDSQESVDNQKDDIHHSGYLQPFKHRLKDWQKEILKRELNYEAPDEESDS